MLKAPFVYKCCSWCFRDIAIALVVILRCVWPMWDSPFKSYEHFFKDISSVSRCHWHAFDVRKEWGDIIISWHFICQKADCKTKVVFSALAPLVCFENINMSLIGIRFTKVRNRNQTYHICIMQWRSCMVSIKGLMNVSVMIWRKTFQQLD